MKKKVSKVTIVKICISTNVFNDLSRYDCRLSVYKFVFFFSRMRLQFLLNINIENIL